MNSYKHMKSKVNIGLIQIEMNEKEGEYKVNEPFHHFTNDSYHRFKNHIESKILSFELKNQANLGKTSEIPSKVLEKIFDGLIDKVKWNSKTSRFSLFFLENPIDSTNQILSEIKGKLEKNSEVTLYSIEDDTKDICKFNNFNKSLTNPPLLKTIVSEQIYKEINEICVSLIQIEEKTKINPLIAFKTPCNKIYSHQASELNSNNNETLELIIDDRMPDFDGKEYEIFDAIAYSFFIVKDKGIEINWRNPLIQKSFINTKVWIAPTPFSSGMIRYAFYMKDVIVEEKLVGKIPKNRDSSYNIESMKNDVESLIMLDHLINEFNEYMLYTFQSKEKLLLNGTHSYIYEILNDKFKYPYLWVENLIEGNYKKYNNNAGWFNPEDSLVNQTAQAFSHFSWQFTKGYMIIVDLQGTYGVFTDPEMHCLDQRKYGKGNLG